MSTQNTPKEALDRYFVLMEQAPVLFESPTPWLVIVRDRKEIETWMETHAYVIGIVHETPWNIHCVDLVRNPGGTLFPYERILPVDMGKHRGTVMIPRIGDDFILIRIFRHALRCNTWEFPRGFNDGIDEAANAVKELREEIGADVTEENVRRIGTVSPNTAFEAIRVDVFEAQLAGFRQPQEEEGISLIRRVTRSQLEDMVRSGEIIDAFTLSALYYLELNERSRL